MMFHHILRKWNNCPFMYISDHLHILLLITMKPSTDSKIISSFHFEFYTVLNTNIWSCNGDSNRVSCISSQEVLKVNYSSLCACFTATSNVVSGTNQLPRLAPNVCSSYQNATDQVVTILYFIFFDASPWEKYQIGSDQENMELSQLVLENGCSTNYATGIKSGEWRPTSRHDIFLYLTSLCYMKWNTPSLHQQKIFLLSSIQAITHLI
jgi:hypothetical protein